MWRADRYAAAPVTPVSSQVSARRLTVGAIAVAVAIAVVMRFASTSHLWLDEALTVNIARLPLRRFPTPCATTVRRRCTTRCRTSGCGCSGPATPRCARCRGCSVSLHPARIPLRRSSAVSARPVRSEGRGRHDARGRDVTVGDPLLHREPHVLARDRARAARRPRVVESHPVADAGAPCRGRRGHGPLVYTTYWAFFLLAVVGAVLIVWCLRAHRPLRDRSACSSRCWPAVCCSFRGCRSFVDPIPAHRYAVGYRTEADRHSSRRSPSSAGATSGRPRCSRCCSWRWHSRASPAWRSAKVSRRTTPARRTGRVRIVFAIGAATLIIGIGEAMLSNTAYQVRYAAVVFPFAALVAGAVLLEPRVRVVVLSVIVVFSLVAAQHWITMERTAPRRGVAAGDQRGARRCARRRRRRVLPRSGGSCDRPPPSRITRAAPVHVPDLASPRFVNWTDYAKRNEAADPRAVRGSLLRAARRSTIWYVWSPGYLTYGAKCEALLNGLVSAVPRVGPWSRHEARSNS